jgi:PAS domain S-box-containing protein
MPYRLQTLSPDSAAGVAIVGVDHRVLWASQALCAMLGHAPDEVIGRTFGEFTHPDDVELDSVLVDRLLAGEISSYEITKRFIDRSDTIIPLRMVASMIRDRDGRPLYGVAILDSPYELSSGINRSAVSSVDSCDLDRIRNAILM